MNGQKNMLFSASTGTFIEDDICNRLLFFLQCATAEQTSSFRISEKKNTINDWTEKHAFLSKYQ
jgi:hypothetical protein